MWENAQDGVTIERIPGWIWMSRENKDEMEGYKK